MAYLYLGAATSFLHTPRSNVKMITNFLSLIEKLSHQNPTLHSFSLEKFSLCQRSPTLSQYPNLHFTSENLRVSTWLHYYTLLSLRLSKCITKDKMEKSMFVRNIYFRI